MSLHDQSQASRPIGHGGLLMAALLCASFSSGCASMSEKISAMVTTTPPTYCDDIPEQQTPFGFWDGGRRWDRWPGAELTIDRGHRDEDKKSKKTETLPDTTEEIPDPNNEMEAGVPDNKDPDALSDDLFAPETNTPPGKTPEEAPPETPETAPETTPEDPLAPLTPPDAMPGETPPGAVPDISDDLLDEKKPGLPPGHSSWESDPLPSDAPQDDLVSSGSESSRKDLLEKAPAVAPPQENASPTVKRIDNARRQPAVRGASAIESTMPVKSGNALSQSSRRMQMTRPGPSIIPIKTSDSTRLDREGL